MELCYLCCESATLTSAGEDVGHSSLLDTEGKRKKLLPGCDGLKSLNEHLRLYFVANKLFKRSRGDSIRVVELAMAKRCWTSRGDADDDKLFIICARCETTVNQALELHYKMLALQRNIDKLGECLAFHMRSSRNEENDAVTDSIAYKIRDLLLLDKEKQTASNINQIIKLERDTDDFSDIWDDADLEKTWEECGEDFQLKAESLGRMRTETVPQEPEFEQQGRIGCRARTAFQQSNFNKTHDAPREDGSFHCKFCDSVYTTVPGIKKHKRMHKESDKLGNIFDCSICRHPNLSDSNLRRHLTRVHSMKGQSFAQLDDVESTVTNNKQPKIGLKIEGDSDSDADYNPKSEFPKHKFKSRASPFGKPRLIAGTGLPSWKTKTCSLNQQTDANAETFACKLCESVYTTVPGYRKHLRMHRQSKMLGNKYDCPTCRHPTVSESNLRRHITTIHGNSLPQQENESSKSQSYEQSSDGNFRCKLCESIYTSLPGFRKHENIHKESDLLGNIFDCPVCRHPTVSEKNLRIHIAMSHQNKISSLLKEDLSKKFPNMDIERFQVSDSSDMQTLDIPETQNTGNGDMTWSSGNQCHAQSTSGNFPCKRCRSVYTTLPGFKKHERMHEKSDVIGNLFDCQLCQHPTVSERNLRIHMTVVHQQKGNKKLRKKVFKKFIIKDTIDPSDGVKEHITSGPFENQSPAPEENVPRIGEPEDVEEENESYFHSSDGYIRCKLCESVYTTIPGVIKHDRMHKESNLLGNIHDCTICRHPNLSVSKLRRHMTRVHGIQQMKERKQTAGNNPDSEGNEQVTQQRTQRKTKCKASIEDPSFSEEEESKGDIHDEDSTLIHDKKEGSFDKSSSQIKRPSTNELFSCEQCNIGYKSARGYQRHKEEHQASITLDHKYDCHCGFPASSERRLRYHKKRAHFESYLKTAIRRKRIRNRKSNGKLECKICKSTYWYLNTYKTHMDDHEKTNLINNIWDCNICSFPCFTEKQLDRHKTQQHERRILSCDICQKTFANHALWKCHMRVHVEYDKAEDPATGLFCCKLCPYVGRSRRALILHKSALHRDVTLDSSVEYLLCPQCGRSFCSPATLRKHIKNIHENTYTYTCEQCGKGFDSKTQFNYHKTVHSGERERFQCDTCGSAYSRKHTLLDHITKYHSQEKNIPDSNINLEEMNVRRFPKARNCKCKWCPAVFPFKYLLLGHMSTSHQDRYAFSCDECDKKYISASSLRLHKEISHSNGSLSFSCKYCQKVFVHKQYVTCHYKFCAAKKAADLALSKDS